MVVPIMTTSAGWEDRSYNENIIGAWGGKTTLQN
jgi:hypothetical protein